MLLLRAFEDCFGVVAKPLLTAEVLRRQRVPRLLGICDGNNSCDCNGVCKAFPDCMGFCGERPSRIATANVEALYCETAWVSAAALHRSTGNKIFDCKVVASSSAALASVRATTSSITSAFASPISHTLLRAILTRRVHAFASTPASSSTSMCLADNNRNSTCKHPGFTHVKIIYSLLEGTITIATSLTNGNLAWQHLHHHVTGVDDLNGNFIAPVYNRKREGQFDASSAYPSTSPSCRATVSGYQILGISWFVFFNYWFKWMNKRRWNCISFQEIY